MPAPARVVQHGARQRDHVGLAGGDDVLGLLCFRDQADRDGGDAGGFLDRLRERHLVAGTERNFLQRRYAAGRGIDPVDAALFQLVSEFDGLREVPTALDPVGRRNLDADGLVGRKRRAHRVEHFQGIAHAVLQAAAILVGAFVGDRGEKLMQQIAVGGVQFEGVDTEPIGALCGCHERIAHALEA